MGLFSKLFDSLKKTKDDIGQKLAYVFKKTELDEEFYEDLEEVLITSDIGVVTTEEIIDELRLRAKKNLIKEQEGARDLLKDIMKEMLAKNEKPELEYPLVIMVAGVNGVGKTTSIGKLTKYFLNQKKSVCLVAGDTFRAAACAQLQTWGDRNKVRVISQGEGADPSAVVFDGIASAKAHNTDVLIIDTAGRLHNKTNLMEELKKINKICENKYPEAMHLNLIVLDATTGQNAVTQVNAFAESIGIDGIILTKLDGSAKGGAVLSISNESEIPILYVGVGEGIDDLEEFDANAFIDAII